MKKTLLITAMVTTLSWSNSLMAEDKLVTKSDGSAEAVNAIADIEAEICFAWGEEIMTRRQQGQSQKKALAELTELRVSTMEKAIEAEKDDETLKKLAQFGGQLMEMTQEPLVEKAWSVAIGKSKAEKKERIDEFAKLSGDVCRQFVQENFK